MAIDTSTMHEGATVLKSLMDEHEIRRLEQARALGLPVWVGRARVEKRHGDWTGEQIANGEAPAPYEVVEGSPQLLTYGGASCLWETLIGNGTATAGQALTYFSNARAAIGTGDSATAAAATQTDLQAVTNLLRKGMDATYPTHTDATTSGAASIVFQATFGSSEGNYAWNEWGVFNSSTAATGRMLNRKAEGLGTKVSGASWSLSVTLSLS
jgi:hypothetical protein